MNLQLQHQQLSLTVQSALELDPAKSEQERLSRWTEWRRTHGSHEPFKVERVERVAQILAQKIVGIQAEQFRRSSRCEANFGAQRVKGQQMAVRLNEAGNVNRLRRAMRQQFVVQFAFFSIHQAKT